jgi:hypothetical protein
MIIEDMRSNLAATPAFFRGWWRTRDDRPARTTVRGIDALNDHLLRDIGLRRIHRGTGGRRTALWP